MWGQNCNLTKMRLLSFLTCSLLLATTESSNAQSRIYGGTEAQPNSIPYMVSLQFKSDSFHFCGGVIVDKDFVVTAAHCCSAGEPSDFQVVAGEHDLYVQTGDEQVREIESIIIHEEYDDFHVKNNICLLRLSTPFNVDPDSKVKAATFARPEYTTFEGMATVYGWGSTETDTFSEVLLMSNIPIIPDETCEGFYGIDTIELEMMCAGEEGKDACQKDGGSPLVCKNPVSTSADLVCGLVSFGYGCGEPGFPGVYTEMSYYYTWMIENTGNRNHDDSKLN